MLLGGLRQANKHLCMLRGCCAVMERVDGTALIMGSNLHIIAISDTRDITSLGSRSVVAAKPCTEDSEWQKRFLHFAGQQLHEHHGANKVCRRASLHPLLWMLFYHIAMAVKVLPPYAKYTGGHDP